MAACVFTIDVEDWFHILDLPGTPPLRDWHGLESRVERNTHRLLDVMDEHGVRSTMFFLGWVADRFPQLVHEAVKRGHEAASHGYAHELVYTQDRTTFLADIRQAKDLVEQAGGQRVQGYRCPGFSVTARSPWFFDAVAEAGYTYDSSVWPGLRGHGGLPGALRGPHTIHTPHGPLREFPISLVRFAGRDLYFFGGGYLRFFPLWLIRRQVKQVLAEDRDVIFYLHPREVDPGHPRLPMSARRRFMSYTGLATTEPKLRALFQEFRFVRFVELM